MSGYETEHHRRHFYSEPLAAAWMAKHFGMEFQWFDQADSMLRLGLRLDDLVTEISSKFITQFLIHPDSLHLLEPMVGDMISHLGMRAWRINGVDERTYTHPAVGDEKLDRFTFKSDSPRIVQRNGIPFHWPEVEATEGSGA